MRFDPKNTGKTRDEVALPTPRRDGVGAALRAIWGSSKAIPDEFDARLTEIDEATGSRR
jgi:hypothetical protein